MMRHAVTDEEWALVEPLLPIRTATTGCPPSDPRVMWNGILWIMRTGEPWRDLPERYGPWQTIYTHFRAWRSAGVYVTPTYALFPL